MAVTLIIEDGSGVANANCYGITTGVASTTLAAARQWATNRGIDLSLLTDDQLSVFLINGTDYLESLQYYYVGRPTSSTQSLSWPRKYIRLDPNTLFPTNEIPQSLLNALYQLCIEQNNGINLLATDNSGAEGGFVIMDKTDVLETQYSERLSAGTIDPILSKVNSLLAPITNNRMGASGLIATRG